MTNNTPDYEDNLLEEDASNNDLMKELQHQNKEYLEKIIEQNEIIIKQNEELLNAKKTY